MSDPNSQLLLVSTLADLQRKVQALEADVGALKEAMVHTQTGALKATMLLPNPKDVTLSANIYELIREHNFFAPLFLQSEDNPKVFHLQAPLSTKRNENGMWKPKNSGFALYLGGLHTDGHEALLWRQSYIGKLMSQQIGFVYPAETATKRMAIGNKLMAGVVVCMQAEQFDCASFAEVFRAMGVGLLNVYVVNERYDGLCLSNTESFKSCFRDFAAPWSLRLQVQEVNDLMLKILRAQTVGGHVFATTEECFSEVLYRRSGMIFDVTTPKLVEIRQQLDIVQELSTVEPKSDVAWILQYAYMKMVIDTAIEREMVDYLTTGLRLNLTSIDLHVKMCESLRTNTRLPEDLRSMLAILMPVATTDK